jgi:CheY-like chemotaxis protein
MMPMVDGFATLEQIKKDERLHIAKSFSPKGLEQISMTKPFSIKKLVEQVQELIR